MIHVKKVNAEFFEPLRTGAKTFELRQVEADEPDYAVGDYLALNEYRDEHYTGRCLLFRIEYVLAANGSPIAALYLRPNVVALGLRPMPLEFLRIPT